MQYRTSRRQFLSVAASGGAGLLILGNSRSARSYQANEKLNIAVIGAGGRGAANLGDVASETIVALCDADERRAASSFARFPQAKRYFDYRRLLEELDRQIDAVVVSTPNHVHAPASVTAMRMGKHAYCEKPLSHSIYEARVAARVAAEMKVATQMGTQIHATDNYRRVVELIRSDTIGPVREVHCWVEQGIEGPRSRPQESVPVPEKFHWDLWLGPAPSRPYHPCYFEKRSLSWQNWWDFGNGAVGDMGSHIMDLPFWALELQAPTTVEAEGPLPVRPETYPDALKVRWEHPARGNRPPLTLTWYDGKQWPESPAGVDLTSWHLGTMFVGDKGILVADYGHYLLLPEAQFKDFQAPQPWIAPSLGHHEEWVHACKTGAPTLCNFDYSGALVEHNLLGTVAFRTGQKLQWDAERLTATNCPAAEQYLRKAYRDGWAL